VHPGLRLGDDVDVRLVVERRVDGLSQQGVLARDEQLDTFSVVHERRSLVRFPSRVRTPNHSVMLLMM